MLYQNHQDIRHAFEMSRAEGPDHLDYQMILHQYIEQMRGEITRGQTVIITKGIPKNQQSISTQETQETALEIRNEDELVFYQSMLAQAPEALESAMLQAKLQKAK